ncbi:hypothetical protein [uncultured Acinetobacter sp.]|uniref:RipA family octameric membrane protein n=1 Tax=uncultured Acinetobacter sp. TaxID=165433 RepID=UPI002639084E|nr:hypothetical protein [uncultured Acinetobacter sp.]
MSSSSEPKVDSTQSQNNTPDDKEKRLKKIYEISVKTRNFEIGQLLQRNNFFMIFQGVLFACLIYSSNTVPFVQLCLCLVGIGTSYFQYKVAAGAKFWQEYWESEVVLAELKLQKHYEEKENTQNNIFHPLFTKNISRVKYQVYQRLQNIAPKLDEQDQLQEYDKKLHILERLSTANTVIKKPSVSKIPIQVGKFFLLIWSILGLSSLGGFSHGLQWLTEKGVFHGFPNHKEAAKQEIYLSQDKGKTGALYVSNDKERNHKNEIIGQSLPFEISNNPLLNNKTDNKSEVSEPKTQSNEVYLNINIDGKDAITQYEPNNLGNK